MSTASAYTSTVTSETPAAPPALQERSRLTHERLFAAGIRLLEEGGPEALTVAAVAEGAGVSVGSVYRRFGDKERLLAAIQTRFTDDFRAEFRARVSGKDLTPATPAGEVIASAVLGVVETFRAHALLLRVFMLMGAGQSAIYEQGSAASIQGGRTFRDTVMLAAPAIRHHPDVEAAIDFAYRLTYGSCSHRVILGENLESTRPLSWDDFARELTHAVASYLLSALDSG